MIARQFGFSSWPKLKAHLELVARYARSPHNEPVGGPLADEQAVVDEFLRLACLTYGDDDAERLRRAQLLLQEHEWLARASIHTIAATGEVDAARELLARDPAQASLVGGPHRWEPLLYLTYSRVPLGPGRSAVGVARLLLEHGADPNAGYLWEGLVPPFTALTGALGGGGALAAAHRRSLRSRVCCWRPALTRTMGRRSTTAVGIGPQEDWLELLFEFGLGIGDGGPWRRLLGERQDSPREMVEDLLMAAAGHGFTDRVRRLLARGVDPDGPRGRSIRSIRDARRCRRRRSRGTWTSCPCWSTRARPGSTTRSTSWSRPRWLVTAAPWSDCSRPIPACAERAIERCPDQLVRAAGQDSYEAVAMLIELGFDVNARSADRAAARGRDARKRSCDQSADRSRRGPEQPRQRL